MDSSSACAAIFLFILARSSPSLKRSCARPGETTPGSGTSFSKHKPGYPVITTLELTDYLDPFPNVTVPVANLGGAIPFHLERMDEVSRVEMNGEPLPSARLRRCYVDTASFGPRAIELAVACFGADRVVLGTDCPIFDSERMLRSVAVARLDDATRSLLLSGTAQRLLQIEPAARRTSTPRRASLS